MNAINIFKKIEECICSYRRYPEFIKASQRNSILKQENVSIDCPENNERLYNLKTDNGKKLNNLEKFDLFQGRQEKKETQREKILKQTARQ